MILLYLLFYFLFLVYFIIYYFGGWGLSLWLEGINFYLYINEITVCMYILAVEYFKFC